MIVALLLLLGCWTYYVLAIIAAWGTRRRSCHVIDPEESRISIIKPLSGFDEGLEQNLESYFRQDYTSFKLYFAVTYAEDPGAALVRKLQERYPAVRSELLVTGEPPYSHDKVYKLQRMLDVAEGDLIVMSDSDVRVDSQLCRKLAVEFQDPACDLVTCPYRAIAGASLWSRLEALSMNTDFHAGLFTAVLMEGARFAVGPTIVARREVLLKLGGMKRFKDYLSEDFELGRTAAEAGFGVHMSRYIVEHRIGSETLIQNFAHRLRWVRGSRRSRPAGYFGQFFTYPTAAGLCLVFLHPLWKILLPLTILLRIGQVWTVSERTLKAAVPWLLLPLHDLLNFGFWVAGFFGNTVVWRGRRYLLNRDGTLETAG